jgi:hypothetical protein
MLLPCWERGVLARFCAEWGLRRRLDADRVSGVADRALRVGVLCLLGDACDILCLVGDAFGDRFFVFTRACAPASTLATLRTDKP